MQKSIRSFLKSLTWIALVTSVTVSCIQFPQRGSSLRSGSTQGGAPKVTSASPTPSGSPAPATADAALTGYWQCSASEPSCDTHTVRQIDANLGTIESDLTLFFPLNQPTSICRLHEKAVLSLSDNADKTQYVGKITAPSGQVVASNLNTDDCPLIVKSNYAGPDPTPTASTLNYDKKRQTLSIDGVKYTKLSDQVAKNIIASATDVTPPAPSSLINSSWRCIDASCDGDVIHFQLSTQVPAPPNPIPSPLSTNDPSMYPYNPTAIATAISSPAPSTTLPDTLNHIWLIHFENSVKCLGQESIALTTEDPSNVTQLLLRAKPSGDLTPLSSTANSPARDCQPAVAHWRAQIGSTQKTSDLQINRIGVNKLQLIDVLEPSFPGQNYIRCTQPGC